MEPAAFCDFVMHGPWAYVPVREVLTGKRLETGLHVAQGGHLLTVSGIPQNSNISKLEVEV